MVDGGLTFADNGLQSRKRLIIHTSSFILSPHLL
jgi:hypothetical protein